MTRSRGLDPERAARLGPLVEECRPLLAGEGGMAAVQRMLSDRRVGVIDAVVVTCELLGAGPGALAEAKTVVLSSAGRRRDLEAVDRFAEEVERAAGPVVRPATAADVPGLVALDPVAADDPARRAAIRRWCGDGSAFVATDASEPLGYCVLEYTFFEQGFVTMLMVAPGARRRGIGASLLRAAENACVTPKLFTSANVSNQPVQRLLHRAGWTPAGLLHGLDDGDPELFFRCPPRPGHPTARDT
ncbi:GNAT family N-acetyltransferase [Streptomyces avicenniae]|uniref:GNAT family N-acetyltransferase n=1 Tax=Streptomyces avicenniae TaxID=500153 RepID=UPI000A6BA67C|nr:GNAT family N-acetyltransferase [Streptomyces avicenniae]